MLLLCELARLSPNQSSSKPQIAFNSPNLLVQLIFFKYNNFIHCQKDKLFFACIFSKACLHNSWVLLIYCQNDFYNHQYITPISNKTFHCLSIYYIPKAIPSAYSSAFSVTLLNEYPENSV